MNLKQALLAGSVLALPAAALLPQAAVAQPIDGLYVGAGGGANWLMGEPNKGFAVPGRGTAFAHQGAHFDTGWAGLASVGWGFGNGLRAEVEGDYRRNQLRSVTNVPGTADGFENKYGAMVNILYDLDLAPFGISMLKPYVGAGAGYMFNEWQGVAIGGPGGQLTVNGKHDTGLAYQGIVGFAVAIPPVPGLDFTVEYRFFDMPENRKYGATFVAPGGRLGGKLTMGEEINQSALIGLRYALFTPPPPAPPAPAPAPVAAPAPAPSRTYLVFFDWDKADLTERARQIISEAAQNSTRVQVTRIEVNGYTDTSGLASYNQKLSVRRADAVAAELVKDGVPQAEIVTQGFGDTHLLVPTAAGVREPQNRRVEIILK